MAQTVEQAEYRWISDAKHQIEHEIQRNLEERDAPGRQAAVTFNEVMKLNMGAFMPPRAWAKQYHEGKRLEEQTEDICVKLGSGDPKDPNADIIETKRPSGIVRVDDVTGEITEVPSHRNICFLPSVAKRNRREQVLDLEYYLSKVDGRNWRYIVVTFGDRIPAYGNLKEARRAAVKQVARWRERVLKKLGIQVGFVGWEYPRNDDGTYHLHANVLIKTPYFLDRGEAFRARTHAHFGTWWKDNGKIENVQELVKYPFKPNSIRGAEADELKWLYHETFGERITNILGPIQKWRKTRKESGLKVFRMKQQLRLRYVCRISAEDNCFDEFDDEKHDVGSGGENVIVGRESPSFRNGLWATSGTLVWNYNSSPDIKAIKSQRRLKTMMGYWADARVDYAASGAPDPAIARQMRDAALAGENGETNLRALWRAAGSEYIVHNDTITSHDEDGVVIEDYDDNVLSFSKHTEDPPDPPPGTSYLQIFDQT